MKLLRAVWAIFLIVPCLVYVGWFTDNVYLKSVVPGITVMNPMTALCFIVIAIAIGAKIWNHRLAEFLIKVAGSLALVVGSIMVLNYLTPLDLRIDRLIFNNELGVNRMAPNTALNLVLVGIILLLYNRPKLRKLLYLPLALNAFISILSIIGYLFGLRALFGIANFNPMAIHTATEFLLLDVLILVVLFGLKSIYVSKSIIASLILAIVVLASVSAISERSLRRADVNQAISAGNVEVDKRISGIRFSLIQAETDQRGYLLTGNVSYLASYDTATKDIKQNLESLKTLLKDDANTQSDLQSAETNITLKLSELNETLRVAQQDGQAAALEIVTTNEGQQYKITILQSLENIENQHASETAAREAIASKDRQNTVWFLALSTALNIILTIIAFLFIQRALKDREDSLKTLETERLKLEGLLASIGDGVFVINKEGQINLFNRAACAITGYKESDVIGKPYKEVLQFTFESSGKVNDEFITTALSGKTASMANHTMLKAADDTLIPVADSAAPVFDEHKRITGAIVVFRDVSQEREVDKAKEEFLQLASHQLRTPATAVKQFLGLVIEGYAEDKKQSDQFIKDAYESNDEQLQIIDDILSVAKLDAGKMNVAKDALNLVEVVDRAAKELDGLAKSKKHTLTVNKPSQEITIIGDKLKLTMCVQNLISNAIKYTPDEGKISVEVKSSGDKAIVTVTDNGIGISRADQKKLFTKFGRLETEYTAKVQGTGLGLYLVKQFIELHGGTIQAEPSKPKGSRFIIELPKEK